MTAEGGGAGAAPGGGSEHAGARTASIIVRTKDEGASLGATLAGVLAQRVPAFEIIVIDSGSRDDTIEVASHWGARIMEIPSAAFTYPGAINLAAATAQGEIIVCLSAHCPPASPEWLGSLLRHFDDPTVAGVWGSNLRPGRPRPRPGSPVVQGPGTYTVATRAWGLSNSNAAIRRDLWEQFPFDESMPAAEDKAWGMAAMERGYSIVYEPVAAVWHGRHSLKGAYRRNLAVQAGFAMIFPELKVDARGQMSQVASAAMGTLRFHATHRQWGAMWYDLRRVPISLAALVGGARAYRRK